MESTSASCDLFSCKHSTSSLLSIELRVWFHHMLLLVHRQVKLLPPSVIPPSPFSCLPSFFAGLGNLTHCLTQNRRIFYHRATTQCTSQTARLGEVKQCESEQNKLSCFISYFPFDLYPT